MGKQSSRSRKTGESNNIQIGKGKVTPAQVAFIVDCYLGDNSLAKTRSAFRSEAPHLFPKSPVQSSPKVLSLGELLDEYICLKEQKLAMDRERGQLEQEKFRLQNLLKGMQDVMNAYNAGDNLNSVSPLPNGGNLVYNTPTVIPTAMNSIVRADPVTTKRKRSVSDAPAAAKRSNKSSSANRLPPKDAKAVSEPKNTDNGRDNVSAAPSSAQHSVSVSNVAVAQGSNVAKCLFNQANQSPPTNSSGPKTPEKSISPLEITSTSTSANDVTPQQLVSSNCMIISSSETIRVSPSKQLGYYSIERNRCISALSPAKANFKRDHVKGRLDFDAPDLPSCSTAMVAGGASTSESDEGEFFDLDLANLDALGMDFNLSELLVDFDLAGASYCSPNQDFGSSPEPLSDSPNKSGDADIGSNQLTVTEVLAKDTGLTDQIYPETVTTMKSVTKCIKILSPVKVYGSSMDQRNHS